MDEGAASLNANDVLLLRTQLKSLGERAVITNKTTLEVLLPQVGGVQGDQVLRRGQRPRR